MTHDLLIRVTEIKVQAYLLDSSKNDTTRCGKRNCELGWSTVAARPNTLPSYELRQFYLSQVDMPIKVFCPVYKIGDTFHLINGFKLIAEKPLCMHSLSSLMPYYVALSQGISPTKLGLAREGEIAYVQRLDPCKYTGGSTVIFEIKKKEKISQ